MFITVNGQTLHLIRDGSFSFFFKRSFRCENDDEKTKNETIVFKNDDTWLTIVNDDHSLTIVNEEKRREETDLKGIGTYHCVV